MNIHEYQGKELFRKYNVPVPNGILIHDKSEAVRAAGEIGTPVVVVKAQIHAGVSFLKIKGGEKNEGRIQHRAAKRVPGGPGSGGADGSGAVPARRLQASRRGDITLTMDSR